MRKIIAIIFTMSLFAIGADAAVLEAVQNFETGEYTVSGTVEEARSNRMLSISVSGIEDYLAHISYIDTDFYGSFSYTFKMPETAQTGKYTIKLGAANLKKPTELAVDFVSTADVNKLISDIQAVSTGDGSDDAISSAVDSIYALVDGKLNILGVDDYYYSSFSTAQKKQIAKAILENRESYDTISVSAAKEYAVLILNVIPTDKIPDTLEIYKDIYGTKGAACYTEYTALKSKSRFNTIFDTYTIENVSDVVKALNEATVIAMLESSQPGDINMIFTNYSSVVPFSLDTYNRCDSDKVAYGLAGKTIDSMSVLSDMIDEIFENSQSSGGSGGSVGGGNGSGGSGGSYYGGNTSASVPAQTGTFTDLSSAEWARNAIETLAASGIVSGVDGNRFEPQRNIKREEFVKIVLSAFDLFDENYQKASFIDIENSWAYPYICKANTLGIVNGIDETTFGIGEFITREDMAVILVRAMNAAGMELAKVKEYQSFADEAAISGYAADSIKTLVSAGVISGFEDNTFAPKASATRAQSAMMVYQIIK